MLASRVMSQSVQLRRSYIAISYYIRRGPRQPSSQLRRGFVCQSILRNTELEQKIAQTQPSSPQSRGRQDGSSRPNGYDIDPLSRYQEIFALPRATAQWERWDLRPNQKSTIHGYFTSSRRGRKNVVFVDLVDPQLRKTLQLVVDENVVGKKAREYIQKIRPHSPVAVVGQLLSRAVHQTTDGPADAGVQSPSTSDPAAPNIVYHITGKPISSPIADPDATKSELSVPVTHLKDNPYVGRVETMPALEMAVDSITPLNHFPEDIIAQADTNFPPEQRHLQLRTSTNLRRTLQARSKAQTECRKYLFMKGFDEIETPILFKSTPEGAREFLVPTRKEGLSYALPQSPQQFKQILMASGISKYFQFARCFRDEDMRADRQPEFTQLDIEMSFASAQDVMKITERIIQVLWKTFFQKTLFEKAIRNKNEYTLRDIPVDAPLYFPQLTYNDSMRLWGSDKPDMRLKSRIFQVENLLDPALKSKITSLKDPTIDLMRVPVASNPAKTRQFIGSFLDRPSAGAYMDNPHGSPGIFIFDPTKPMSGLAAFEHEAAQKIVEKFHPQRGDLLVLQARPKRAFAGESSTMMGNLRRDLHTTLVAENLVPRPRHHEFVWITDFPLFSPTNEMDPGQGGKAGIKSTHHPFTAPKTLADVKKMTTKPLTCKADHFDLVIDGVEVGGGSRRIHDSKVQEMVFKDILKIPEKQAEEFRPLLEALRAGCPPHAGIAIGFDRLMAIMRETSSVRDVIAFPKSANGEDKMFGAPSAIDSQRWAEYHMAVNRDKGEGLPHQEKEKDGMTAESEEVQRELRSASSSDSQIPGATQPDESDITPSAPS